MKKLSLIVLLFSFLIITWCGKINQGTNSQVETGIILTWTEDDTCGLDKLANIPILIMDDLVKNCTETKTEWNFIDWLWWVFPDYVILKNKIVTIAYDDPSINTGIICEDVDDNKFNRKFIQANPSDIPWYDSVTKVIGKWLIDRIAGMVYPDNMFCKDNDTKCKSMIDYGWRTDGTNYFVAWFRSDLIEPEDSHILYVINDKLYNPWTSKLGNGVMDESKRNFVTIQNNKIIVKKLLQWEVVGNIQTMDVTQLKSKFILKTCEINLQ